MCGGGGSDGIKETDEERALAEVAASKWSDYQERIAPLENQFMQDVRMQSDDYRKAIGGTGSEVVKAFTKARDNTIKNQAAKGIAPGSGRFVGAVSDIGLAQGESAGAGMAKTAQDVDDLNYKGLEAVVGMGRGQESQAQLGMTQLASTATNKAIGDAQTSMQKEGAQAQALGTMAGMGYGAWDNREQPVADSA